MLYITYDSLNKRIRLDDDSVFICQYRAVIAPVNSFVTLFNPAIHLAHTKAQFSFFLVLELVTVFLSKYSNCICPEFWLDFLVLLWHTKQRWVCR